MAKVMTETQESGVETAFEWMLQAISGDLNLSNEQAEEALSKLKARVNKLTVNDLMPEEE